MAVKKKTIKKSTKNTLKLPVSGKKYMTQVDYAEARGITPPRVSHLIKKKIIVLVEGTHKGKKHRLIDVKQADIAIANRSNPSRDDQRRFKNGTAPPPEPPETDDTGEVSFDKSAAKEKRYKAGLAKLEYEKEEGTLVNAADVEKEWSEHIVSTKGKLRSIPNKAAQKFIHTVLNNSKKSERALIVMVQKLLLQEIDEALEDIANESS